MFRKLPLLCLVVCSGLFFSCHKSNDAGGNSGQLAGNYKFAYINVAVQSVSQTSAAGQTEKSVSNTNYKTTQNTGTITFTKDSIIAKGVGYTANWVSTGAVYENGVFIDSISLPFSFTYPPSNSSTKFDVIGKDSIYFHGGYFMTGLGGGTTIAPPSGGRFSFKGDTLLIISKVNQTSTQSISGMTVTQTASGVATLAMLKQ